MPNISLRLSEQEKILVDNYAKLNGLTLSDVFKKALFEKLEDEYDLKLIKEYEKKGDSLKTYTLDEVEKELGF
ncbi:MAG: type II toxin-antitoxin system RelB family antitoxin [Thermodesulfobacteriota bacterium]